jgi:hypothetical protein
LRHGVRGSSRKGAKLAKPTQSCWAAAQETYERNRDFND